jgi:hypothetical protein
MDCICFTTSLGVCVGSAGFGLAHCFQLDGVRRKKGASKKVLKLITSARKAALQRRQGLEQQLKELETTVARQDLDETFALSDCGARVEALLEGARTNEQRIAELEALLAEKDRIVASLEFEKDSHVQAWEAKAKKVTLDAVDLDDQDEESDDSVKGDDDKVVAPECSPEQISRPSSPTKPLESLNQGCTGRLVEGGYGPGWTGLP